MAACKHLGTLGLHKRDIFVKHLWFTAFQFQMFEIPFIKFTCQTNDVSNHCWFITLLWNGHAICIVKISIPENTNSSFHDNIRICIIKYVRNHNNTEILKSDVSFCIWSTMHSSKEPFMCVVKIIIWESRPFQNL